MSLPTITTDRVAIPRLQGDLETLKLDCSAFRQRLNDLTLLVTTEFDDNIHPVFQASDARFTDIEAAMQGFIVSQQAMSIISTADGDQLKDLTKKSVALDRRVKSLEAQMVQSGQAMASLVATIQAILSEQDNVSFIDISCG